MITKKQLLAREKNIGGSDLSTILGFNPYKSPYELWLEKTNKVTKEDLSDNKAIQAGVILEDALLKFAELSLGKIERKNLERRVEGTPILVHLDGIVKETGFPVECKTGNLIRYSNADWGDKDDEVPHHVIIQAQGQLMALKSRPAKCHVPALIGGKGLVLYSIDRNEEIILAIKDAAIKFWDNVVRDIPPKETKIRLEMAKALKRIPNKVIELPADDMTVHEYVDACEQYRIADQRKKEMYAQVLAKMGDAEVADFGTEKVLTYFGHPNKGHTVEPFIKYELRWVKRGNLQLENKTKQIEEKSND